MLYIMYNNVIVLLCVYEIIEYILFVFVFDLLGIFYPIENFHLFGDVPIAGKGLQIFTYARYLSVRT